MSELFAIFQWVNLVIDGFTDFEYRFLAVVDFSWSAANVFLTVTEISSVDYFGVLLFALYLTCSIVIFLFFFSLALQALVVNLVMRLALD